MNFRFHPTGLLFSAAMLFVFGAAIDRAIAFRTGAAVGVAGFLVYLCLDVLFTFSPATRSRLVHRRSRR